ncbi:MAG: hypothetical protein ABEJ61_02745 [Haloferacaceae archaeon]
MNASDLGLYLLFGVRSLLGVLGALVRLATVGVVTVVGWVVVRDTVNAGRLPAEPLGLADAGLPATLFGLPTAYAGGLLLFAVLVLFGESGGGGVGVEDGGFGGVGDGGGGDGGGDGE